MSLIALALVFILLALVQGAMTATGSARVPFWQPFPFLPSLGGPMVVMTAWLAVVLLGLTGRRGKAAAIASISLTAAWLATSLALLTLLTASVQQGLSPLILFLGSAGDVPVVLASLAAC